MRHILSGLTKRAAAALVVGALAAPTAAAQAVQDLRSPDTSEAATHMQPSPDLRSPDARDAAQGRGAASAPEVVLVKVTRPQVSRSGGFDWEDAGIGAGAVFGLVLLGMGAMLVVARRGRPGAKRPRRTAPAGGCGLAGPVREPLHARHSQLASGARYGRHLATHAATKEVDHEV
jgi:hypothetical protein